MTASIPDPRLPGSLFDAVFPLNPDSAKPQHIKERALAYEVRKQFAPLHQRSNRWACIVAHRRAGKTVACVNELIIRALYTTKKNARYAYIAPFYAQAKQVAWTYLKDFARPFVDSFADVRESDLSVTLFNGSQIRLYGADNPDALRGIYLDGVILDEYGDCRPSLWGEVIRPTLADRKGWAVFIGTPKGKNHFYDIRERARQSPDWLYIELKASETGILPPEELEELRQQMSDSEYEQELECSFSAALLGTYYSQIIAELERKLQIQPGHPLYDPDRPVEVAADLGRKDSTALWFWQDAPDGIAVIDYYENQGKNLEHYFDLLDSKPYTYSKIWLPSDARAKTLATRRSTLEQFLAPPQHDDDGTPLHYTRDPYPVDIAPNLKRQQGIDAARLILHRCWFNQTATFAGIEALRAYRRQYDEVRKVYSDNPLHDWASDGADAFRYLALVAQQRNPPSPPPKVYTEQDRHLPPPEWRLDELWSQRDDLKGRFSFEKERI